MFRHSLSKSVKTFNKSRSIIIASMCPVYGRMYLSNRLICCFYLDKIASLPRPDY